MTTKIDNQKIAEHYDKNQILYNLFWSRSLSHYGLWDAHTKDLSNALLNTNKFVCKCLEVNQTDNILDAGCGVGGVSIYIAENYKAKVFGITLSDNQLNIARQHTLKSKASKLLNFSKQDFIKTQFQDNYFSKIFGIESICHANNKIDFLKEAFRLLKNKGKVVICDGFLVRTNFNKKEIISYKKWLNGWALTNLATKEEFYNDLKKVGFRHIKYCDKLKEIKKSRDRIYRLGFWGYPFSWFLYKIGSITKNMHDNTIALIHQKRIFSDANNIATYGVFVAEK